MLPDLTMKNTASNEFILHWAQWWGITLARLINTPPGEEHAKAMNLHDEAKSKLSCALGVLDRRAEP